jgi:hypothetical protein
MKKENGRRSVGEAEVEPLYLQHLGMRKKTWMKYTKMLQNFKGRKVRTFI